MIDKIDVSSVIPSIAKRLIKIAVHDVNRITIWETNVLDDPAFRGILTDFPRALDGIGKRQTDSREMSKIPEAKPGNGHGYDI